MEIIIQTFFIMHSQLYSFTEPLLWGQEKRQIIKNNSTIKYNNNNISIYCHHNNSPRTHKHKVFNSDSGSSWTANCWSSWEIFEKISQRICHLLSIRIRQSFGPSWPGWVYVLHASISLLVISYQAYLTDCLTAGFTLYFIILKLRISDHSQGFYSPICCTNHEY